MNSSTDISRSNRLKSAAAALALCAGALSLAACTEDYGDAIAFAQQAQGTEDLQTAQSKLSDLIAAEPENVAARMAAGDIAMRLGNYDGAISAYREIGADVPETELARTKLAKAYMMNGNLRMAGNTLEEVTKDSALARSVRISMLMAESDYPGAKAQMDSAFQAFPDAVELLPLKAEFEWLAGNEKGARAAVKKGLAKSPADPELNVIAGRVAMHSGDPKAARAHFQKALEHLPNHQPSMLAMAALERDSGNNEEALKWLDRTQQSGKTNPVAVYFAAQMAFDAGQTEQAYKLMQTIREAGRQVPAIARLDGMLEAQRGQPQSAIASLSRYVQQGIDDPLARLVLAQQYMKTGKDKKAWATIQPDLGRADANTATLALGVRLAAKYSPADSAKIKAKLAQAETSASLTKPMIAAGKAIRAMDWQKADKILAPLANGKGANNAMLLNNAANVKLQLGENEAALALAKRALVLAPSDPGIMDTMGWVMYKTGQPKAQAKAYVERAMVASPGNLEISNHYNAILSDESASDS